MRISDWSSDVCSSDLIRPIAEGARPERAGRDRPDPEALRNEPQTTRMSNMLSFRKIAAGAAALSLAIALPFGASAHRAWMLPSSTRSEEHTSELQSLMRISYAVFCLKKNTT